MPCQKWRTTREEKIRALGHVLANGLSGHATVDQAQILAAALDAIEAPHIQVLAAIRANADAHEPQLDRSNRVEPVVGGMSFEQWGGPGRWAITDLGRACLDRLEEAP